MELPHFSGGALTRRRNLKGETVRNRRHVSRIRDGVLLEGPVHVVPRSFLLGAEAFVAGEAVLAVVEACGCEPLDADCVTDLELRLGACSDGDDVTSPVRGR